MRQREVIQAGNVGNRHTQVERRLAIRREERTVFRGMPIDVHPHVEGPLHLLDRAADGNDEAIRRRTGDSKAVRLGPGNYGLIVVRGGSIARCEFIDA